MREGPLDTSSGKLRSFGLLVGLVVALIGGWMLWKGHGFILLCAGPILMFLGLVVPRWLKWLYVPWMTLAFALGFVMTRVLLTILFFVVITPVGLIMRMTGRDPLNQKFDRDAKSYWIPKEPPADLKKHLERYY